MFYVYSECLASFVNNIRAAKGKILSRKIEFGQVRAQISNPSLISNSMKNAIIIAITKLHALIILLRVSLFYIVRSIYY